MIFRTVTNENGTSLDFAFSDLFNNKSNVNVDQLLTYNQALESLSDESLKAAFKTKFLADNVGKMNEETLNAIKSSDNFTVDISKYTKSATGAAFATKALSVALNAITAAGVSLAISGIIKLLDYLIVTEEEVNESVELLMSNYKSAINNAKSNASVMQELIPSYAKLSKGVNALGENVSLTNEEFKEYQNTVNKIASMYPKLVNGWTQEGDAIINLKDNVDTLTNAYKEEQKAAYNSLIIGGKNEDGEPIIDQWKNVTKQKENVESGLKASIFELQELLQKFSEYSNPLEYSQDTSLSKEQKEYIRLYTGLLNDSGQVIGNTWTWSDEAFSSAQKTARTMIQELQAEINNSMSNIQDLAYAYLYTNDTYENLNANVQTALTHLISSIDVSDALEFKSKKDVGDYVNGLVDAITNSQDAQVALLQLFTLDSSKLSIDELRNQVNDYINMLAEVLGEDPIELKVKLGFDYVDTLGRNYDIIKSNAKKRFGRKEGYLSGEYNPTYGYVEKYDSVWENDFNTWYDDFVTQNSINTQDEIAFWNQCISESETREEAMDKYLNSSVVSKDGSFSGFTEEQSKQIDDFQSKAESLGNTLKSLRNGEEINVTDLIQEFPELAGHVDDLDDAIIHLINGSLNDLINSLKDVLPDEVLQHLIDYRDQIVGTYPKLTEAYGQIHSTYDILQQMKEEFDDKTGIANFTDSTLQSIAGINEHLNSLVAGWHANGVSAKELYDALNEQYQKDLEDYGQALVKKYETSSSFYKSVGMLDEKLIKQFAADYKVDLTGCATYAESKQAIHEQLTAKLSSIWTKFYDENTLELTSMGKSIEDEFNQITSEADMRAFAEKYGKYGETFLAEYSQAKATVNQAKKTEEELNKNIYKAIADAYDANAKSLKDNADSTKSEYNELFDFFERRLEIINQSLEKLDVSLEEVNGSMAKNILIAGKIGIVQEEIKDYTTALGMYEKKANAELAKLSTDLQDKIKNGAVSITQLIGENGEEVNKTLEEYKKWADKVNDCNQQLIELKETLRDLALEKFNNVVQDYTDQFDIVGMSNELIEKQISLFEEAGQLVGKAFYESQIATAQKQKEVLEKEKAALIKEMTSAISSGLIQKGTDEWLEMVKGIQEVDSSILDVDQSVEQLQNSLLELNDKVFDRLQNAFSDINSQLSNIVGMISDVDVSDEQGVWSKEGLTQLGAYAQQYELARHNVEKYEEEINKLNQAYGDGLYSTTEYIDKLSELAQAQWEQANAAEDAKKSILELNKARVELIKEGIQKQIDAYQELINKQKEALDQEKAIRDYEKTIAEKSKNINKLQNQINLLRNDDSAAANAKRIKLEQELADAMKDLEETQYDHSIEAQKEALDKQMEDYEDARQKEIDELEAYLKEVEKVQADSFEIIKQNTDVIANEIENIAKTHGVIISEAITKSWAKGEGAIASYGTALSSASSGFIQQIQTIELYLTALQDEADFTADRLVGMLSAKADNLLNEFNAARDSENDLINATNLLNEALIKTLEGGYDISGIIGSLKAIQDQADATRKSIDGDDKDKDKDKSTTVSKTDNGDTLPKKTPEEEALDRAVAYDTAKTNSKTNGGYANYESINNQIAANQEADLATKNQMLRKKEEELSALLSKFQYKTYWNPQTEQHTDEYTKLKNAVRGGDSHAGSVKYAVDNAITSYLANKRKILEKYAGFATGVHNISRSQFAWTQEDGHELVLSPTRNAMFTKLNKGDTVLTKEQTDNLFKLSKIDPESIFGNLRVQDYSKSATPVLSIGNIVTVNGNVDDTNIKKIEAVANSAVTKAFKKFSDEIIKR